MKEMQSCRFECHEYTWSEHGISGYPVGWRIKASSREDDRDLLSRIEKAAASAGVDSQRRIAVEELIYDRSLGFIKMVSEPARPGKDHRKNIRVRLYHPSDREAGPHSYLAPHDQWPENAGTSLPGIQIDPIGLSRSEILSKYHLQDHSLASFIDQVFSCIGRKRGICFGILDWEERQFASRAAEVMLAVHLLLPEKARKYAGYVSFSRESRENVSFYFQPRQRGGIEDGETFVLPPGQAGSERVSAMQEPTFETPWQYMCFHLSRLLGSPDSGIYDQFISRLDAQMTEEREAASSDFVRTIPWIFYHYFRERGGPEMGEQLLIHSIPQLCYWKAGGLMDETLLDFVMGEVRKLNLSETDLRSYLKDLTEGMTSRTRQDLVPEITRVLGLIEKKESQGRRQNPWISMLASLPMETAPAGTDSFADEDTGEPVFVEIEENRQEKEMTDREELEMTDREELEITENDEIPVPDGSLPAKTRSLDREEEGTQDYLSFLIGSIPRGFLTGCMLFLSIYSVKIGHGKIALGMAGVWLIVMLNEQKVILEKRLPYPVWMVIGLALVEGLIIAQTGWFLFGRKARLLFFLIIGIITLLSQLITILRIVRKDR